MNPIIFIALVMAFGIIVGMYLTIQDLNERNAALSARIHGMEERLVKQTIALQEESAWCEHWKSRCFTLYARLHEWQNRYPGGYIWRSDN